MASPKRSTKRRSTKRRSSKRRMSSKMVSWTRKLMAWRKANKHKDGSLPSLKQAMKACKGKSSRRSKCRKNSGRHSSKRRSSKRRSSKRRSSKRRSSKRRSSKRRSSKRRSSKRRSSKRRSSKRRSSKRRSSKRRSSKRRSSKRRSSKRRSSKRRSMKKGSKKRSSKRRSAKKMHGGAGYRTMDGFYYYDVPRPMSESQIAWNAKLQAWREMNRKADGSLPSMKAAMKACKGRAAFEKECRKSSRYGKYPMTAQWKELGTRSPKTWADCGSWNDWKNAKKATASARAATSARASAPRLMLTN